MKRKKSHQYARVETATGAVKNTYTSIWPAKFPPPGQEVREWDKDVKQYVRCVSASPGFQLYSLEHGENSLITPPAG